MKKLLYIILFTILCLSYTLCARADGYDKIKVGLFYGNTAKSSVNLSVSGGVSYGYLNGNTHVEEGILYGTDFTVSVHSASSLVINDVQIVDVSAGNLSIIPLEGNIKIDGTEYRGGALFACESESKMCVMNILNTEEYLYGVIGGEMPSSWNTEALKAQAICARGFAVSNYNKHASLGFNVCSTTNCQVYKGVSAETNSVRDAVDSTYGQILTYDGKVAQSLFYSSSGGHTANSENVWGSSIPYLKGVEDPYESENSPRHSWSATLSNEEIAECFAEVGPDIGVLKSLSAKTDETGRTYELTAVGTLDTYTLKRQITYTPFYSKGVLSQKYTISPVLEGAMTVYAMDKSKSKSKTNSHYAVDSKGKTTTLNGEFSMISGTGTATYTPGVVTGYTFSGGGWGHGVGMSQYGAKGMADAGFGYAEILAHYYPGTELTKLYEEAQNENQ